MVASFSWVGVCLSVIYRNNKEESAVYILYFIFYLQMRVLVCVFQIFEYRIITLVFYIAYVELKSAIYVAKSTFSFIT